MKSLPRQTPDDFESEEVQRLALFSSVAMGLWLFGLVMDLVVIPRSRWGAWTIRTGAQIEILGFVFAIAARQYMKWSADNPARKTDLGIAFMLLNAVLIAVFDQRVKPPVTEGMALSWNMILILVYAAIVPTDPRKVLVASLAAATSDPVAHLIARHTPLSILAVTRSVSLYLPGYACAIIATLPGRILRRWGARLAEARQMGSYRLIELLGRGGMGEVWRGQHRMLARDAAIKLIRPELLNAGSPEETRVILRRFEREARATAALRSPHSVQVFDFGTTDEGVFYYVMELLDGCDLETLVKTYGPIPPPRAVFLLRQICHSLADAHARGLMHRDVKPGNISICRMGLEDDFVKVLDFGLVKFNGWSSYGATNLTIDRQTSGTPAYMAPEAILGNDDVDCRADVYSLGCVAYYMLTGRLVFEGETPMKILIQHVHAVPIKPSRRTEHDIPKGVEDIIMQCLHKDPDRRPANASDLLQRLTACDSGGPWNTDLAARWWTERLPEEASIDPEQDQSLRSATIGSTFEARSAGK